MNTHRQNRACKAVTKGRPPSLDEFGDLFVELNRLRKIERAAIQVRATHRHNSRAWQELEAALDETQSGRELG